jgi:FlaA1/EpsC-like NDP-sugar epimerase/lipopolysaccharide/colanic/teichoic acid biosynthesis glycosyltransferase
MNFTKQRLFDLVVAVFLLVFCSPAFLLITLLIRLTSPGPAFFRQTRLGRDGKPFRIFKFRTMAATPGPRITVAGDRRITPIGKFLRSTKLDEIPQLLNVLRGEMSLVGPRPEVPEYHHVYRNGFEKVLQVRPGITDPVSLELADEELFLRQYADPLQAYEKILLPRKLQLSLNYLQARRLRDDVRVLILTVLTAVGLRYRAPLHFEAESFLPKNENGQPIETTPTMLIDRIPVKVRRFMVALFDLCGVALALYLAFLLRFEADIPADHVPFFYRMLVTLAPLRMIFFYWLGLYRGLWRYTSIKDLMTIFRATALSSLAAITILTMVQGFYGLPRSVFIIEYCLSIFLVGGMRFLMRALLSYPALHQGNRRVLIVGAGDTSENLLREILYRPSHFHVVGLVDDDPAKQRLRIHGVPVLGNRRELAKLVSQYQVEEIFIAMPSASGAVIRDIVSQCQAVKVQFRRVPAVKDLLNGRVTVSHLSEVQLEDLLGREPITLDNDNVAAFLRDKIVMVTGAGGSIGSELCRQVAHFRPRLLVMLDQAENGLYHLEVNLQRKKIEVERHLVIADITDPHRLQQVFARHRPQIIFHAAAHKHVPLMELNKSEAIKNNVLGSRVLAETAQRFGAEKFVMISTDKAVNPSSIMGASKRLAEMLLQEMARRSATAFITVRFGNVLGSEGSVVPLFKKQLLEGGPLTVTHPEIERYFMTIPEAVQLVLQAGAMGKGGEIFVLDMGQPIKIIDLARNLITLSGYKPEDIGIKFIGLRPGEKLYEELWIHEEKMLPTPHRKIMVAQATSPIPELNGQVDELLRLVNSKNEEEAVQFLRRLVPNYRPPSENHLEAKAPSLRAPLNGEPVFAD